MILNGYFYPDWQWINKPHVNEITGEYSGECAYQYIVGNRRAGKSVGVGIFAVADYLIYGYRCGLIRLFLRNFEDRKKPAMEAFWERCWPYRNEFYNIVKSSQKLQETYPLEKIQQAKFMEHELTFESHSAYIDGKLFCTPIALNVFDDYKSGLNFENCRTLIYDEFISEQGQRLPGEVSKLYNVFDTVARNRDDALKTTGVIFISNAVTTTSDYFTEFGIDREIRKDTKRLYRPNKSISYEMVENKSITDDVVASPFGKLLQSGKQGKEYLGYAQSNTTKNDTSFVQPLKGNFNDIVQIRYEKKIYAFRYHYSTGLYYFTDCDIDKKARTYALTLTDHSINTILINTALREQFDMIRAYYRSGQMRFNAQRTKDVFLDIYRYL